MKELKLCTVDGPPSCCYAKVWAEELLINSKGKCTVKRSAEALLINSKGIGVEGNGEKLKLPR